MRTYLAKMRIERHMSQQDVARAIGISESYYDLIERGERQKDMDYSLLVKFSCLFNTSIDALVSHESRCLHFKG